MKRVSFAIASAAVSFAAFPVLTSSFATGGLVRGTACMAMDHTEHGQPHDAERGADPTKGTTREEVVCPLDGMKMQPSHDTPSASYRGKTYYFCSGKEKETFLQNPERYVGR